MILVSIHRTPSATGTTPREALRHRPTRHRSTSPVTHFFSSVRGRKTHSPLLRLLRFSPLEGGLVEKFRSTEVRRPSVHHLCVKNGTGTGRGRWSYLDVSGQRRGPGSGDPPKSGEGRSEPRKRLRYGRTGVRTPTVLPLPEGPVRSTSGWTRGSDNVRGRWAQGSLRSPVFGGYHDTTGLGVPRTQSPSPCRWGGRTPGSLRS